MYFIASEYSFMTAVVQIMQTGFQSSQSGCNIPNNYLTYIPQWICAKEPHLYCVLLDSVFLLSIYL